MTPEEIKKIAESNKFWELGSGDHLNMIFDLLEEIDRLKSGGWISVDERLPEKPGYYIIGHAEDSWSLLAIFNGTEFLELPGCIKFFINGPTHWQPLPEPPKEDEHD